MRTFGDTLKYLRKRDNVSQEQLAKFLGVARSAVSMYENGTRTPLVDNLEAIADYFNVDLNFLRAGADAPASTGGVWIPVLGEIAAGVPISAVQDILDYEEIPTKMAAQGEHFALRIKGDSMQPRFVAGDIVIVRQQECVEDGDVAAVLVNGDSATVKQVRIVENGMFLTSYNPTYQPLFYSNYDIISKPVTILGKVVELRGKM